MILNTSVLQPISYRVVAELKKTPRLGLCSRLRRLANAKRYDRIWNGKRRQFTI
jgi:hypothetical protein